MSVPPAPPARHALKRRDRPLLVAEQPRRRGRGQRVGADCSRMPICSCTCATRRWCARRSGPRFRGRVVQSFIARLPGARRHYQKYLPLMPLACEQLDLSAYDLVISSESGPCQGRDHAARRAAHLLLPLADALRVGHVPRVPRSAGRWIARRCCRWVAHYLRLWDRRRPTGGRVRRQLGIRGLAHPQATTAATRRSCTRRWRWLAFDPGQPRGDHYLVLGQLVRYKRADLAVQAFNELGLPLDGDRRGRADAPSCARWRAPTCGCSGASRSR